MKRRGRGLTLTIVALVAVGCTSLLVAPAQAASDSSYAASVKAKRSKVCKKKRYRSVACKKLRRRDVSIPTVPRRVTLTWDTTADINLKIYDLDGHRAGLIGGSFVNEFPGATHLGNDTDGFGPETFDDPSGRRVGYLVCYVSGPRTNVTLIDSGTEGGRYTDTLGPVPNSTQAYHTSVGWGYLPVGAHC